MGILSPLETVGSWMWHDDHSGIHFRVWELLQVYIVVSVQVWIWRFSGCLSEIHFKFWHMRTDEMHTDEARTDEKVHSVICSICMMKASWSCL